MRLHREIKPKARIEMLPLIDIVFLLLVFFIYAMLSMAIHRALPVELPVSRSAEVEKRLDVSITVKADGTIFINKNPVSLEQLARVLDKMRHRTRETGVLLFADRHLSYQKLFRVLDEIQKAGLSRISFQAEADKAS